VDALVAERVAGVRDAMLLFFARPRHQPDQLETDVRDGARRTPSS
jgi:hypothetical protein